MSWIRGRIVSSILTVLMIDASLSIRPIKEIKINTVDFMLTSK